MSPSIRLTSSFLLSCPPNIIVQFSFSRYSQIYYLTLQLWNNILLVPPSPSFHHHKISGIVRTEWKKCEKKKMKWTISMILMFRPTVTKLPLMKIFSI